MSRICNPTLAGLAVMTLLSTSSYTHADEWEFSLAPLFLWGISIDGDATLGTTAAPLELNFVDDILENLDAVFTVHFEARNGELTYFAEIQYVNLQPSLAEGPIAADIEFKNTQAELGAGWAFADNNRTRWEMLLGLRYMDQEVDVDGSLNLPDGPGPIPIAINGGDSWYHPFLGLRMERKLTTSWTLLTRGDFGYSSSDNRALNLSFIFDYRFKNWGSAFVGYRYMDFDYDEGTGDDRYAYDAVQQGPLVGISIHW